MATIDLSSSRPRLAVLPGEVVLPGEDGWDQARLAWHLTYDQRPAAVARPRDAAETARLVRAARRAGLRVAPQSTGHNAPPLGDLSDALLMRMDHMDEVVVDADALRVRVGAGTLWGDVVEATSPLGLAVLHGSSPDVGVAGYALHGGVGWMVRRHGLATNSVTAVELVTADGEFVRADRDTEPELFWGLRGGGGNLGVVTAIELRLFPQRTVYAGWLIFDWTRSHEVLRAWEDWTHGTPEDITSVGRILQLPPIEVIPEPLRGRNLVVVEAAYLGSEEEGRRLLAPLRALGPEMDTFRVTPPDGLARLHQDPEGPTPATVKGGLLDRLPAEALDRFIEMAGPGSGSPLVSAEIRQLGGAASRPDPDGGVMSHMDGQFIHLGIGMPMAPGDLEHMEHHLERYTDALRPYGRNREYLNFEEKPTDTRRAYTEDAHRRLQALRDRMDPDGVLRPNHPVGGGR
jgi:FAD/FMN-containing dehydrogenase